MRRNIFFIATGLIVGSVIVHLYLFFMAPKPSQTTTLQAKYPMLAPRILIEHPNDTLINFLPLRKTLTDYTTPFGNNFAMYFEYLPTGTSIGVNSTQAFNAASLIKVPVVMAYYRQIEKSGLIMDNDMVKITTKNINKDFGSLWKRGAGAQISMSEAVKLALVESDNTAEFVIADHVSQDNFDEVYQGLDIDLTSKDGTIMINAKNYTSILKALYFSAILSEDDSQQILSLLTKTTFDDKLVAGVPKGVTVAHKIGVYGGTFFSDCGIVYVPKRPYLLCMISQDKEDVTQDRMKHVSAMIYDYVSKVNIGQ